MRSTAKRTSMIGLAAGLALFFAACSSSAATVTPTTTTAVAGATETPAATTGMASQSAVATSGAASVVIGSANDASLGSYLTGPSGMTLYLFKTDTADTSSCAGTCATNWPPLTAAAGATITQPAGATGTFATITRADGTVQVTYNHLPLYYYAGDSSAGQTNGQGKGGVWFVAPLAAAGAASATPAATAVGGY